MEPTLDKLSKEELDLYSRVEAAIGTIEEKSIQLRHDGIYDANAHIFEEYVVLAASDSQGLEALKRATFLYWSSVCEPPFVSGLWEFDESFAHKLHTKLELIATQGGLDEEFIWMLCHYDRIAEWAFSKDKGFAHVRNLLIKFADVDCLDKLTDSDFKNRGRMGLYWRSVLEPPLVSL